MCEMQDCVREALQLITYCKLEIGQHSPFFKPAGYAALLSCFQEGNPSGPCARLGMRGWRGESRAVHTKDLVL